MPRTQRSRLLRYKEGLVTTTESRHCMTVICQLVSLHRRLHAGMDAYSVAQLFESLQDSRQ